VAGRHLRGLAQADDCTFASMAPVVDHSCVQQFQHFITNSPCHHEPVVAQIGQDADRLLGGKPTSCPIMQKAVLRAVRNLAAVNLVRLPVAVTSATASPRRTETSAQFCTPASSLGTDSPVSLRRASRASRAAGGHA